MTLGEIKIAAIRLMFDNLGEDLRVSELPTLYEDENYKSRLVNMTEIINRALDKIMVRDKLPLQTAELSDYLISSGRQFNRYDISQIYDFYKINKVVFEGDSEYLGQAQYRREGSNEILLPNRTDGDYRLIYHPKTQRITEDIYDDDELRIPNEIAGLIPYFIKAELYEEDEPNAAATARQVFENGLDSIVFEEIEITEPLKIVYSG